jgi:hypothetical protein
MESRCRPPPLLAVRQSVRALSPLPAPPPLAAASPRTPAPATVRQSFIPRARRICRDEKKSRPSRGAIGSLGSNGAPWPPRSTRTLPLGVVFVAAATRPLRACDKLRSIPLRITGAAVLVETDKRCDSYSLLVRKPLSRPADAYRWLQAIRL